MRLVPDKGSNTPSQKSLQRSQEQDEARSPLERFRVKPKKPLSVTDLVSPAWCELQYWYTLTRFGRKPQTEAMRQGSKVHKTLEEQVHSFIPVRVESKEDAFGLRMWNTIQGLRTLQEFGFTRELEVWGTVHGQVVNGVIDEISYACPDPELEEGLEQSKVDEHSHQSDPHRTNAVEGCPARETPEIPSMIPTRSTRRVYITDVKTRGVRSLPIGARLRPTRMQLMLYHTILGSLVAGTVDPHIVLERYSLQPHQDLSATLIQEFEGLELSPDEIKHCNHPTVGSERNYTLSILWDMMVAECRRSISDISDIMRAEFRLNTTGDVIGNEIFVFDEKALESYVSDGMAWWKGERAARGVEIEEAYKCRTCTFADECSWRKIKIEEATERHKLRRATRDRSII
ncbi:hypothetical protein BU24DRAFT_426282 [Aaosphaeria arxii CBS 175.79]|uniref:Exonuclease V n=1 Tax=Aaosphaeria arxii CBS 175.79 TaxID=1450172 RepID=A0A6A5XGT1_9PLEO|nr:uncharacterized protein BU24DRAFT_426282 [Aaosphaeria arxii CBS 175.79]KAF2012398.1 hypothetical protein BU24DRAFT_426282 [Aaosphaeria arxii CBS 175.79]